MYYEYWGLNKPPFDNVPDPTMYVESHESVENTIAETLFAIEEGNECVAVIVGDVGLGKTMSLRMILGSLDQEKFRVAFITNPDMSFIQLLREIIGQLTGTQCETKGRVALLEIFNRILFETFDQGKKVLIFIDEANALTPANLESVRLLTNMQDDSHNLCTIILAGQLELAQRLEHPKRANLFQRIGTYSRLNKIESETLVRNYVETRLRLAGGRGNIFTDAAIHNVWESSEHGVPRLINKICKLSMKAGETNELSTIDGGVVAQIASRFEKLTGPAVQKRRPRKRLLNDEAPEMVRQNAADVVSMVSPFPEEVASKPDPLQDPPEVRVERLESTDVVDEAVAFETEKAEHFGAAVKKAAADFTPVEEAIAFETEKTGSPVEATEEATEDVTTEPFVVDSETQAANGQMTAAKLPPTTGDEEELCIGGARIPIVISPQLLEQVRTSPREHRDRTAGILAAQTLEKHHGLVSTAAKDPVAVWGQIKDFILVRFEQQRAA
jgi:type II secretory pathway predicted ATPase ExeA